VDLQPHVLLELKLDPQPEIVTEILGFSLAQILALIAETLRIANLVYIGKPIAFGAEEKRKPAKNGDP